MSSRKARRIKDENTKRSYSKTKKKLIIMLISVALMIFSVTQVYYLLRYTLGYSVSPSHLKVYKWITLLVNGNTETETSAEVETN